MTNNPKNKNQDNFRSQGRSQSVSILQFLILLVVMILPLAFIIFDLTKTFINFEKLSNPSATSNLNKASSGNEYNFESNLPVSGDLSNVSKDKIDTLFNNLK